MKKYNRKTGTFDIFINKNNINKILKEEMYQDSLKENINNNTIENFRKLPNDIITKKIPKLKDNNFCINNNFSNKYLTNTINTSTSRINNKKIIKKNNSHKNRRINTEININLKKKNNIQDLIDFVLDNNDNDKKNKKLNPINKRKNSEQNKIIDNVLDPYNPYSTIWPNKFLNINYNSGIRFAETEQGVPQLRIKKLKKQNLPPLSYRNILKEDNIFCKNINSRLNKNLNNNQSYKIYSYIKDNKRINDINKSNNESKQNNTTTSNFIVENNNKTEVIKEEM